MIASGSKQKHNSKENFKITWHIFPNMGGVSYDYFPVVLSTTRTFHRLGIDYHVSNLDTL